MKNGIKSLGQALLGIAPTLASALIPGVGGAIAGSAIKAVSGALGVEASGTPDAAGTLSQILADGLTPEQMAAVRAADNDFAVRMKELGIDLARVHQQDRDSARRMQARTRSWTAPALAVVVMAAFMGAVAGVFWLSVQGPLEATLATLIGAVVGYASAKADQVVSFYFGSSQHGEDATEHLAEAARR